jgi:hypothetical protein
MVAVRGVHRRTVVALTTITTAIFSASMYLQLSFLDSCVHSNVLETISNGKTRPDQLPFEAKEHIHRADKSVHAEPVAYNRQQRARILVGIFTADFREERRYRKKFRELFQLHPRACSLADFTTADTLGSNTDTSSCEIIYTFVAGANPHGPTELVDGLLPMLVERPVASRSTDFNDSDMTLLNIRYVRGWEYTIICHL